MRREGDGGRAPRHHARSRSVWSFRFGVQNALVIGSALTGHALAGIEGAVGGLVVASGGSLLWSTLVVGGDLGRATGGAATPPGAMRFAALQGLGSLLVHLTHRGGIVAVAVLAASNAETGFAALALGVTLAGTYAIAQLFTVQLPLLVARHGERSGGDESEVSPKLLAARMLAVVTPLALLGAVLAEPLAPVLFGERFSGAGEAIAVALAALPLAPVAGVATQASALRLRAGARAATAAVGALAFALTAAACVPALGATGASAALVAGTFAMVLASTRALPGAVTGRLLAASTGSAAAVLTLAFLVAA